MPKGETGKPRGRGGRRKGDRKYGGTPEALAQVADLVAGGESIRGAATQVSRAHQLRISWERLRTLFAEDRESLLKAAEQRRRPIQLPPTASLPTAARLPVQESPLAGVIEQRFELLQALEGFAREIEAEDLEITRLDAEISRLEGFRLHHDPVLNHLIDTEKARLDGEKISILMRKLARQVP